MNDLQKIPVKNKQLTIREIGDEVIILSEEALEIHNMEGTAAYLWGCIDGASSLQEILDKLCNNYEVMEEEAKNDILEFFQECEKKKLISFA